jgi:predicted NBD/HSP70 family sugar kinase
MFYSSGMPAPRDPRRPTSGAGRVLELIRTGQATTRLALTRDSGLARATVNDRIELLLDAELIVEDGSAASTGGRRAVSYAFNHRNGVVLVADLGSSHARFAACDLGGNILADERHDIDIRRGPEPTLELVTQRLPAVLEAAGRPAGDVIAVTVGVPGPVQIETGTVVAPPIMTGWDGVHIPTALRLPFDAPVLTDNDVNLMALGEHRAVLRSEAHVLVIKAGTGVGSGIISAGRPHRGAQGAAGDIGHIPAPGVDAPCVCGRRGCVEAQAGGWALARDLRDRGHDVEGTADVVRLLVERDADAMELLQRAGKTLGVAVADAVTVLNPSTVILGGDIALANEQLLAHVREVVYTRALPLATRSLRIALGELGDRAGVVGGTHRAIEHRLAAEAVDAELEWRLRQGGALNAWSGRAPEAA